MSTDKVTGSIFGYDLKSINWKLVSYVLIAIAVMVIGTFYTYSPDALARTILFAIGGSLVFYFFYLRWFGQQEGSPDFWPPSINTCPDYLTLVNVNNASGGGTRGACVDYLGIAIGDNPLQRAGPGDTLVAGSGKVFQYTSSDVAAARSAAELTTICNECRNKGVTWEGVWDGDNCVGLNRYLTQKQLADDRGCPNP
jgi:hypothetical protein